MAKLDSIGNWLVKHAKIVMPAVLLACVAVTVIVSLNANKKETQKQEDVEANSTLEEGTDSTSAVPEVPLQENTDPEIAALINAYYTAMADGDVDMVCSLVNNLDNTEVLRIREQSKYIESWTAVDIYTKTGPKENTVLVYIRSELKFADVDQALPGMKAFYVHIDENGEYRIEDEKVNEDEADYIKKVGLQDDVVDMNNRITAEYNDIVTSDADLAEAVLDIQNEIEKNVGEALARAEEANEPEESTDTEETNEQSEEPENSETVTVVTRVRATDVVNIRSSDSETADKLGKAAIGDEFVLLEKIGNGWSRIEYEGREAYIKSEFLEDIETAEVAAPTDNTQEATVTGTVTVTDNVRIRSAASETSEKLGVAYAGDKLELVMRRADGWTEIKYNGRTAFVKSDFVE